MLDAFRLGNFEDGDKGTGVTVILAPQGAQGGVSVMGNAPATRETELLKSEKTVQQVNAVVLSGGSAFGLDASSGVMEYCKKRGIGLEAGSYKVPIVVGASLFDLEYKTFAYPDKAMGQYACEGAGSFVDMGGDIGAGCGATVGKLLGMDRAAKGKLGVACLKYGAIEIAAVVAVNAFGNIYDPDTGALLAGLKAGDKDYNIERALCHGVEGIAGMNTTIGCIVTNAKLTKSQCNALASSTNDAYARCIRPVHTVLDGDSIFVLASGEVECNLLAMQSLSCVAMCKAIKNAFTLG